MSYYVGGLNMAKKNKNGYVLKSDVLSLIQSYIRDIQMMDSDAGIPQLYAVMASIDKMPTGDIVEECVPKWTTKG